MNQVDSRISPCQCAAERAESPACRRPSNRAAAFPFHACSGERATTCGTTTKTQATLLHFRIRQVDCQIRNSTRVCQKGESGRNRALFEARSQADCALRTKPSFSGLPSARRLVELRTIPLPSKCSSVAWVFVVVQIALSPLRLVRRKVAARFEGRRHAEIQPGSQISCVPCGRKLRSIAIAGTQGNS